MTVIEAIRNRFRGVATVTVRSANVILFSDYCDEGEAVEIEAPNPRNLWRLSDSVYRGITSYGKGESNV